MVSIAPPSSRTASIRPARPRALRVLVVDDEAQARRSLAAQLMEHGFDVLTAEDGDAASSLVETSQVDVVLADLEMPGPRGAELIQRLKSARAGLEVVIIANAAHAEEAAQCVAEGAFLFLLRPTPPSSAIAAVVQRAGEKRRMVERGQGPDRKAASEPQVEVIAISRTMRSAVDTALGAAQLRTAMLLVGEPGTGKQLLARAVHQQSPRANHPFVLIRCSLLAPDTTDRNWLDLASGGTLFLDEIGELAPALQARLLDALHQDSPDVRVIASASSELKDRVDQKAFRSDLYYRLQVVVVRIPALRRRKDDIPVLAYHLLHRSTQRLGRNVRRIGPEALRLLRGYPWPGNVRELESVIERAVAFAKGDTILPGDLEQAADAPDHEVDDSLVAPLRSTLGLPAGFELEAFPEAKKRVVEAFETAYAEAVLRRSGGNIAEAAQLSGLDRSNFRRILKRRDVSSRKARSRGTDEG